MQQATVETSNHSFVGEIKSLIDQSRRNVAITVNAEITLLYWHIGNRINTEVLKNERAEYGKEIIATLSKELTEEFGSGWRVRHLHHCLQFAQSYQDIQIVHALRAQLSWTHIKSIVTIGDELKRSFYIEMCRLENWSTRQLQERINSMLYERTAISRKPEETIKNDLELLREEQCLSPDLVFKDPYFLDFLGLHDIYSEKYLESAILAELQRFIIVGSNASLLSI
jgi:DUF1016 N-terminal domain